MCDHFLSKLVFILPSHPNRLPLPIIWPNPPSPVTPAGFHPPPPLLSHWLQLTPSSPADATLFNKKFLKICTINKHLFFNGNNGKQKKRQNCLISN